MPRPGQDAPAAAAPLAAAAALASLYPHTSALPCLLPPGDRHPEIACYVPGGGKKHIPCNYHVGKKEWLGKVRLAVCAADVGNDGMEDGCMTGRDAMRSQSAGNNMSETATAATSTPVSSPALASPALSCLALCPTDAIAAPLSMQIADRYGSVTISDIWDLNPELRDKKTAPGKSVLRLPCQRERPDGLQWCMRCSLGESAHSAAPGQHGDSIAGACRGCCGSRCPTLAHTPFRVPPLLLLQGRPPVVLRCWTCCLSGPTCPSSYGR